MKETRLLKLKDKLKPRVPSKNETADYFCAMFHCIVFQTIKTLHLFFKLNILTRSAPRLSSSADHLNTSCQHEIEISKAVRQATTSTRAREGCCDKLGRGDRWERSPFCSSYPCGHLTCFMGCTPKCIWIFETLHCEIKEDVPEPKGINIRNNGYYGREKNYFSTVEFILWRHLYSIFEISKH